MQTATDIVCFALEWGATYLCLPAFENTLVSVLFVAIRSSSRLQLSQCARKSLFARRLGCCLAEKTKTKSKSLAKLNLDLFLDK